MKKSLIVLGLLAVSSLVAFAGPARTSKPVPLTDAQMKSVKGQGYVIAYVWNGSSYVAQAPVFTHCMDLYSHHVYSGGPQNGQQYHYPL